MIILEEKAAPHSPGFVGDEMVSAVDWLGARFFVGNTVLYCVAAGGGQTMALGVVQKIRGEKKSREMDYPPEQYPDAPTGMRKVYMGYKPALDGSPWGGTSVWEDQLRAIVIYEWWEIEVKVLTSATSGSWNNNKRVHPAWVNSMNITALPVTV